MMHRVFLLRLVALLAAALGSGASTARGVDLYQSLLSAHESAGKPPASTAASPPLSGAVPGLPVSSAPQAPGDVIYADFLAPASGDAEADSAAALDAASEVVAAAQTESLAAPRQKPQAGLPLRPAQEAAGLPLQPPGRSRADRSAGPLGGLSGMAAVGSSLAVVVGLFLVFAWLMRRSGPAAAGGLSSEVIETLGKITLGYRQQVSLVRCGNRVLLLSVTPHGVETLSEYSDPDEVTRLTALCRQTQPGSASTTFRQVFHQLAGQSDDRDRFESGPASRLFVRAGAGLEDRDG
jgi:flagellar biosynthetic protein FliO